MKQTTKRKLFRVVGYSEGASYLILLGIAMPLKYGLGMPEMTVWTGWIHGLLFICYNAFAVYLAYKQTWDYSSLGLALLASGLPFGTFVFDAKLEKWEPSSV